MYLHVIFLFPSENASLVLSQKNLQVKLRGFEEIAVLEDAEKPLNNVEEKPLSVDEEKLATGTYCQLFASNLGVSAVFDAFSLS